MLLTKIASQLESQGLSGINIELLQAILHKWILYKLAQTHEGFWQK